jgi:hypothetical protein
MSGASTKGDVVELTVGQHRLAYLQDCGLGWGLRLARFLPGVYGHTLSASELKKLVEGPSLYRAHCLIDFLLDEDGTRVAANLPVPVGEDVPPDMVSISLGDDWRRWWIKTSDGSKVPATEYAISHPETDVTLLPRADDLPDPRLLRARIAHGWTPSTPISIDEHEIGESDAETVVGATITQPRTMYLSYFADQALANEYATRMRQHGVDIAVADRERDGHWKVEVIRSGYFDREFGEIAEANANDLGGIYDGDVDISK